MVDEQLEFAISQYADGTLPASQRAALEAQLAADPALVALLEEYRQLSGTLQTASPMPVVDWDRLALHLSDSVAENDRELEPVPIYAMPWVRRVAGLAVAACLAIAVGIGFRGHAKPDLNAVGPLATGPMLTGPAQVGSVTASPGTIAVAGPVADAPAGTVVAEISVGPSPSLAMDDSTWRFGDSGVVAHPQRVVIASSDAPVQDTSVTPY